MGNGDWRRKCASGDPFRMPALLYNKLIDVTQDFDRSHRSQLHDAGGKSPEGLRLVQNTSGADVAQFGVLSLQGIVIGPTDNSVEFRSRAALKGITPATSRPPGTFCIAWEPIPKNRIGRAFVFGVCPVQVNFTTGTEQFADVKNGDATQLQAGASGGAQIIWSPGTTGKQWAIVRLAGGASPAILWGVVQSIWAGPGYGTLSVTPSDSSGTATGAANVTVQIEMGSAGPQYCAYAVNDLVAYLPCAGATGGYVLVRNKLPQMTSQYQGWWNNAATGVNVVADYARMI